jgi:8-oxo-dGTP pyrophosphatase MutT (NUDIX family)
MLGAARAPMRAPRASLGVANASLPLPDAPSPIQNREVRPLSEAVPEQAPRRREAAVIVPVYRDAEGVARLVLIRRSEGGRHGGQLAFPGGTRDRGDRDLLATALREAEEEIGLAAEAIDVLETLTPLDTRTTGFHIQPFLARITRPATWHLAPDEVAEVLEPALADLADPAAHGAEEWQLAGWSRAHRVEFYRVGPHHLWGASYRMLSPVLPRLVAGDWRL